MIELEEVKEWLRSEEDESLIRLIKFAECYLSEAIGEAFDPSNEVTKECALAIIQQKYDGLSMTEIQIDLQPYITMLSNRERT